jgi:hypothetical protein
MAVSIEAIAREVVELRAIGDSAPADRRLI